MGWAICRVDIGYCNTDLALWTDRAMSRVGENFKGRENSAGETGDHGSVEREIRPRVLVRPCGGQVQ